MKTNAMSMKAVAMLENQVARDLWAADIARDAEVVLTVLDDKIVSEVVKEVAVASGVLTTEIMSKSQVSRVANARQFAFYQCHKLGMNKSEIGAAFGRDHSTVCFGISKIKKALGK